MLEKLDNFERDEINGILANKTFIKALRVLEQARPGVFPRAFDVNAAALLKLSPEMQAKLESNRIYEMRGWELYKTGLQTVADLPEIKQPQGELPSEEEDFSDHKEDEPEKTE